MRDKIEPRRILLCLLTHGALSLTGCATPESDYGSSEGKSLNGTSVLAATLTGMGHEVEAAIRINDELSDWAEGIIRFAPYPGPPDREEANWYTNWLEGDSDRWLIYVVGDFDASSEYWKTVVEQLAPTTDQRVKEDAQRSLSEAADWSRRLPPKATKPADADVWFEVASAWEPPRICAGLSGSWATGVDPAAAALTLHEYVNAKQGEVLLAGDGKPFVIQKTLRRAFRVLVIANGSFLLNEATVNPERSKLLASMLDWIGADRCRIALVEGSFVLGDSEGPPSLWQLLKRLPNFRWIAAQIGVAALLAALARAPRLGRPRNEPGARPDRPAAHAEALGSLLARTRAPERARDVIAEYRRWRYPRSPLGRASLWSTPSLSERGLDSPKGVDRGAAHAEAVSGADSPPVTDRPDQGKDGKAEFP
jgi:hypothetical protein